METWESTLNSIQDQLVGKYGERFVEGLGEFDCDAMLRELIIAEYSDQIRNEYNWEGLFYDADNNPSWDNGVGSAYIDKANNLFPSGQYVSILYGARLDESQHMQDELFAIALDSIAKSYGGWIENGSGEAMDQIDDIFLCVRIKDDSK